MHFQPAERSGRTHLSIENVLHTCRYGVRRHRMCLDYKSSEERNVYDQA